MNAVVAAVSGPLSKPIQYDIPRDNPLAVDEFVAKLAVSSVSGVIVSVLDVGCGRDERFVCKNNAIHDAFFRRGGVDLVGLDSNLADHLDGLEGMGLSLFRASIAGDLSCLGKRQFNAILFSHSASYISTSDLEIGARQCAERMPFGGRLIVSCRHPERIQAQFGLNPIAIGSGEIEQIVTNREFGPTTVWFRSSEKSRSIFEKAGFALREVHDFARQDEQASEGAVSGKREMSTRVMVFERIDPNAPARAADFSISLPQLPAQRSGGEGGGCGGASV